ncbi:SAM-dependent methyltransferase [Nocardia sp. BMG51109]|uniref:SAM-dependent methyltransferase n=1 Tax=Nocardia sp. BMG51109 TaxID=1056816 RepID=UPI0004B0A8D3|nr:SAM-dependent methyltransferase [Nocardia sp. BMG51109]
MTSSDPSPTVDVTMPSTARMYDAYLGGKDNYDVDRAAVEQVKKAFPSVEIMARTNRDFMHRATRYLVREAGVRQFLDIGTGIPTEPNLHQVAQQIAPESRVVYVDNDPLVLTYARALMTGTFEGRTTYVHADAVDPGAILATRALHETLDSSRPVALSLIALLHFVPDDRDAYGAVATLMDAFAPGSYLVISHATGDLDPEGTARAEAVYRDRGLRTRVRTHDEIAKFFTGMTLVDPGIVVPHRWRPTGIELPASFDAKVSFYAAVGAKT